MRRLALLRWKRIVRGTGAGTGGAKSGVQRTFNDIIAVAAHVSMFHQYSHDSRHVGLI